MKNELEKEYKILLTEKQFKSLSEYYHDLQFIRQINTYYDTEDSAIERMHGAMRLREKEDKIIFTLKMHTSSGLMEHECLVPSHDITAFDLPEIQQLLKKYNIKAPFHQIAVCITNRAMVVTPFAELCFDINEFNNGITDYEVEYEYKQDHDGRKVFNEILAQINLTYQSNCKSKIKRAMDSKI